MIVNCAGRRSQEAGGKGGRGLEKVHCFGTIARQLAHHVSVWVLAILLGLRHVRALKDVVGFSEHLLTRELAIVSWL